MIRQILILVMLAIGLGQKSLALSDSIPNSKTKELKEVVVIADNQKINTGISTFFPSKSQKNSSQDAWSLLNCISIPQIDVDLTTSSVKTVTGEDVSFFIDYAPATSDQLKGLKTTDVKRVEYLLFPSDARFMNARYAVNFIMQKYESGGYTKINAVQSVGTEDTQGYVYSKMDFKSMSYDVYVNDRYNSTSHNGMESIEYFRFPNYDNQGSLQLSRSSRTEDSYFRNNTLDAMLRAVYATPNVRISNQVGFNWLRTPENHQNNILEYSNSVLAGGGSRTNRSDRLNSFSYNGFYFFKLSSKFTLSGFAKLIYGHNDQTSSYYAPGMDVIINNAKENSWSCIVSPCLYYQLNANHTFSVYLNDTWNSNRVNYLGSSPSYQTYEVNVFQGGVHYDLNMDKVQVGMQVGCEGQHDRINEIYRTTIYPQFTFYGNYSPSSKTQLSLAYNYGEEIPALSEKSGNLLRQDELIWYTGSPTLRNAITQNANASLAWYISNKWLLSASGSYYWLNNRRVTQYSPNGPDGSMLRQYINNGSYHCGTIGATARARFFGSKLTIRVSPLMFFRRTTGIYATTFNEFTCRAQISYHFGNFFLSGEYRTRTHYPEEQSGLLVYNPQTYRLQFGWGNGIWNLNVIAINFCNTGWKTNRKTLSGEYYSSSVQNYGIDNHMKFTFSATYTFGYGKKIQHGNELNGSERAGSAILQ